jgi:glutamate racemase
MAKSIVGHYTDLNQTLERVVESNAKLIDSQEKLIDRLAEERNYYKALPTSQGAVENKPSVLRLVKRVNIHAKEKGEN